jgi:hypothetical protein
LARRIACGFEIFGAIMPHGVSSGKDGRFPLSGMIL